MSFVIWDSGFTKRKKDETSTYKGREGTGEARESKKIDERSNRKNAKD